MIKAKGYAAKSPTSLLEPFAFERRTPGSEDVHIAILYCGICHSDLHTARNEWQGTVYPVVPGHEIVGKVIKVGDKVTQFKEGETVAVGCLVGSCQTCASCQEGLEQYCETGQVFTYNSPEKETGAMTYGGYSDSIVVNQDFVLKVPASLDVKAVAPLLCAGITTYSPMRHWNVKKGDKVGVIGLGGLGHMAIKIAHALGAEVTMVTTSPDKEKDARRLGASKVLISTHAEMMAQFANYFDFMINTIPRTHDLNPYLNLLKRDGTMVIVGAVEILQSPLDTRPLVFGRKCVAGSLIGGIKETQEMLDFCAKHQVLPDIEMIPIQKINEAYERMLKSDVKYRFVIDMASLKQ
ncbi:NAD(P)-dependent alcohol dehydrogenase [Legionella sp. 29fVS95]|uniref:NAD(P)-dependent alcohol dehydrogenase n=1 Tax=Legionella sp. 29fVS95 TaxID=3402813 RepID=UPI003AF73E72